MKTKISKGYQTVVPKEIRGKFGLKQGDSLLWENRGDEIVVKPKKKTTIEDIIGIVSDDVFEADAVALKKKVQRGQL